MESNGKEQQLMHSEKKTSMLMKKLKYWKKKDNHVLWKETFNAK